MSLYSCPLASVPLLPQTSIPPMCMSSTYERALAAFVFLSLDYFISTMISRAIHFPADDIFSFFLEGKQDSAVDIGHILSSWL